MMLFRAGTVLNEFASADAMIAAAFAFSVKQLSLAIESRNKALLLASGGATPIRLYERLSAAPLAWERVETTLVDERWVDLFHEASNERVVRRALLNGEATRSQFIGLKTSHGTPGEALPAVERRLERLAWPADLAVLGMGADGHTASWFPNASGLANAIDPDALQLCAAISARPSAVTGPHTERMTLTPPPILSARAILLLMSGEGKRRAFYRARASGPVEDMPVRTLFLGDTERLYCCWSP